MPEPVASPRERAHIDNPSVEEAKEVKKDSSPSLIKADEIKAEAAPGTVQRKITLPPVGNVEILSMQYSVKYSGKSRAMDVTCHPDECIISTLSWTSGSISLHAHHGMVADSSDGGYMDFELADREARKLDGSDVRPVNAPAYRWRTTKDGRYVFPSCIIAG